MNLSVGNFEFEWLGDWAELPANDTVARGWSHHGMAFSKLTTTPAMSGESQRHITTHDHS